jgi:hypothetical protein
MWALDVEEMESSSKIDNLKDVLWWMSIRKAYRLGALIIVRLLKNKNGRYL